MQGEITFYQSAKSPELLIPRGNFAFLVREIIEGMDGKYRFQSSALEALQVGSEAHLVRLFEDTNAVVHHRKQKTLKPDDMKLVTCLQGQS